MKKLSILLALAMTISLAGCGAQKADDTPDATEAATEATADTADTAAKLAELTENKDYITIELENGESIKAELYPDLAPITVANFEKLISENFYDGLIFHRVISGFMIQGGGYDASLTEKDSEPIKGEFESNGVENPLSHTRGVLSMARTSEPDSASSQFFIMHEDNDFLDGEYAAFGKVTDEESLKVVDEIASAKTASVSSKSMDDVPVKTIAIKTITLED
jgi:peptidyl-prolyl cis-trans isomerase B (cyclophilin B)